MVGELGLGHISLSCSRSAGSVLHLSACSNEPTLGQIRKVPGGDTQDSMVALGGGYRSVPVAHNMLPVVALGAVLIQLVGLLPFPSLQVVP